MKLNSQLRSNNKGTEQQLGEMDYVDFHIRRIADDLRRAGISVPGRTPTPAATKEPQQDTDISIAKSHKSTIYLPHWIPDHREDPALTARAFFLFRCVPLTHFAFRASWTSCMPTFVNGSFKIQI